MSSLYIGIDLGTSGCRCIAINDEKTIIGSANAAFPASLVSHGHITQTPQTWWLICQQVLTRLLEQIPKQHVRAIAVDGTSGTVLLCTPNGDPISQALMYNDRNNASSALQIANVAPQESGAHGASSGLAKCLTLLQKKTPHETIKCLTQADWIAGKLMRNFNFSDQNNSLKLGYDVINQQWPSWLKKLNCQQYLADNVYPPGTPYSVISPEVAYQLALPTNTKIIAGTTDSIAAFIATDSQQPGDAVTSLGSTLAIKLLSNSPIFSPSHGIYSHRLGDSWLVGGASNTGGAVIKKYFTATEIAKYTPLIKSRDLTHLNYYPLTEAGERFPINNDKLQPQLSPRPNDKLTFFQGILEGISHIEKKGYDKLAELGANYPTQISTMGGGSANEGWRQIRQTLLGVPVHRSAITEAAYGAALLAKQGIKS